MRDFELKQEITKVYLRNIYYNDRNNSIVDVYKDYSGLELYDNKHNFENVILADADFLNKVFEEEKNYIKEFLEDFCKEWD